MELGAQAHTHRCRQTYQFARQLVEGMTQAIAQASPWKQGAQAPGGAVKAIGEGALNAVRRLMLEGSAFETRHRTQSRLRHFDSWFAHF